MTPTIALALTLLDPAQAAEIAKRADALYSRRRFAEASAAYAEAFEVNENPDYLYGWAQSERRAGNCPRAIQLYREYAALPISETAREAAAKNAKRCGGDLDGPVEPPPPSVTETPPEREPRRKKRDEDAWRSDVLGLSLVTAGGALGIATAVLAVDSQQQWRQAEDTDLEATYARKTDRSLQTRTAAIVCGSLGAVALAAGVIRLVAVKNRDRPTVAWTPGRGLHF